MTGKHIAIGRRPAAEPDAESWVRRGESVSQAAAVVRTELYTARLTIDVTPELRGRIKVAKRGTGEKAKSGRKPKRTFRTGHKATVTVQSETSRLTGDQLIAALQEALGKASKA